MERSSAIRGENGSGAECGDRGSTDGPDIGTVIAGHRSSGSSSQARSHSSGSSGSGSLGSSRSGSFSSSGTDERAGGVPTLHSGSQLLTKPLPLAKAGSPAATVVAARATAARATSEPVTPVARSGATVVLKGKVVVVGDIAVGKTSIVSHLTAKGFNKNEPNSIGERFRSINRLYYRGAAAGIVVYDITNRLSFDTMRELWLNQLRDQGSDEIIIAVAANKCDLPESEREVSFEEGAAFAADNDCLFAETSAKTGTNVHDLFELIAREAAERCRNSIRSASGVHSSTSRTPHGAALAGAGRGAGAGSGGGLDSQQGFQIVGVEHHAEDAVSLAGTEASDGKRWRCCGTSGT